MLEKRYCICGQLYDKGSAIIQCDVCRQTYHNQCANIHDYLVIEVAKYICPRCTKSFGPSIMKQTMNAHRHDCWDKDAFNKPVQAGTQVFVQHLMERKMLDAECVITRLTKVDQPETFIDRVGFDFPIVVESAISLDMSMPSDQFSVSNVEALIGGDFELDVIDVTKQLSFNMKLKDFSQYISNGDRRRVLNLVSLEFSNTILGEYVHAPIAIRNKDWVNTVWPSELSISPPQVGKYCLISAQNSYTDFHIDFGGTSVWYHVLNGEKVFFLVPPTAANLALYSHWMTSTNQSEIFFGDQVENCYRFVLKKGETMFLPAGWIHAVLTPVDSLVFGGNFLHGYNISMQLAVYEIEKSINTNMKYRYPNFEMINWFAATKLIEDAALYNGGSGEMPKHFLIGLRSMFLSLRTWYNESKFSEYSFDQIPDMLDPEHLLNELYKEIHQADRKAGILDEDQPIPEPVWNDQKPTIEEYIDLIDFIETDTAKRQNNSTEQVKLQENLVVPPLKIILPKPQTIVSSSSDSVVNNNLSVATVTSVQRRGTVLKFKFGSKDVVQKNETSIAMSSSAPESIYDFHEDSDSELESPTLASNRHINRQKRQSTGVCSTPVKIDDDMDIGVPPSEVFEELSDGCMSSLFSTGGGLISDERPVSPLSQDLITSMMSMDTNILFDTFSAPQPVVQNPPPPDEEANTGDVHQDDTYVYPSLQFTENEKAHVFKPRGRSNMDETWNPKARVGPLEPKVDRPTREGTKREAVEKVLEAAAAAAKLRAPTALNAYLWPVADTSAANASTSQFMPAASTSQLMSVASTSQMGATTSMFGVASSTVTTRRPTTANTAPRKTSAPVGTSRAASSGTTLRRTSATATSSRRTSTATATSSAATSNTQTGRPKRTYTRRSTKPRMLVEEVEPHQRSVAGSCLMQSPPNAPATIRVAPVVAPTPKRATTSRPRKGMMTAKQRLGKILKIHKIFH